MSRSTTTQVVRHDTVVLLTFTIATPYLPGDAIVQTAIPMHVEDAESLALQLAALLPRVRHQLLAASSVSLDLSSRAVTSATVPMTRETE